MTDDVLYSSNHWAKKSKKWAEGSDSDVTPMGGTHSSKGWANIASGAVASCQNYATMAEDSGLAAYGYKQQAAASALSASSSAAQALANSQRLLRSVNPANCWVRTYTDLDTEKRYQLVTATSQNTTVTIGDTVYTTTEDIKDYGEYQATITYGYSIGDTLYLKNSSNSKTIQNCDKIIGGAQYLQNGKLYEVRNFPGVGYDSYAPNGTYSDGWDIVYYHSSQSMYTFGIRDGKLYSVINTGSGGGLSSYYTATLLDDTGTWTFVKGQDGNISTIEYFAIGIKDGKLYKIRNQTISLLDDTLSWTPEALHGFLFNNYGGYAIFNGRIYFISSTGVTAGNASIVVENWNQDYVITNDGKLYALGLPSIPGFTQVGSDTGWADLSQSYGARFLAIKSGDLYYVNGSTTTRITTGESYNGIKGVMGASSEINTFVVWEQTPILKYEYVYTTPTSAVGNNLYGSTALANPRAITAISSSSVSDDTNTYTRDSDNDTYFTDKPDTYVSRSLTTDDIIDALT